MRLVIIGGRAAGLSAASRARRIDPQLEIVVLEKSEWVSLAACGLPYYVRGRVERLEDLVVMDAGKFLRERNIQVRTNTPVLAIQHPSRQVVLAGGEALRYDKLVIATGAKPKAAWLAAPHDRLFSLYTPDAVLRLRSYLETSRPKSALVVGGGYIGLEAADVLHSLGIRVTVVERSRFLLGRQEPGLTDAVARHLEKAGVEVRLGCSDSDMEPDGYDFAVVATGVEPDVELAVEAGVRLGHTGAIATDEYLETNLPGVFAAGDCAEARHVLTDRPIYFPLGTTANRMGRTAGACAAGRRQSFAGIAGTAIVQVLGLGIAYTGLSAEQARHEGFDPVTAAVEVPDRARYFDARPLRVELVADRRSHVLLGGSVCGFGDTALRVNVIAAALHARTKVEDLENFDLAYTPPLAPASDPLALAAHRLVRLLN